MRDLDAPFDTREPPLLLTICVCAAGYILGAAIAELLFPTKARE